MRYCPATLALTVALCLSTPGGSSALGRPPRATNALRGQSPPAPSRIAHGVAELGRVITEELWLYRSVRWPRLPGPPSCLVLVANGYEVDYAELTGAHDWISWRGGFPRFSERTAAAVTLRDALAWRNVTGGGRRRRRQAGSGEGRTTSRSTTTEG